MAEFANPRRLVTEVDAHLGQLVEHGVNGIGAEGVVEVHLLEFGHGLYDGLRDLLVKRLIDLVEFLLHLGERQLHDILRLIDGDIPREFFGSLVRHGLVPHLSLIHI